MNVMFKFKPNENTGKQVYGEIVNPGTGLVRLCISISSIVVVIEATHVDQENVTPLTGPDFSTYANVS